MMDVMNGRVVHAVRGEREKYKPLKSILTKSSDPLSVALAFKRLGLRELYVADLDAIILKGGNPDLVGRIVSESGMGVMVDAGFRRADEVWNYIKKGVEKIVLATETLEGWGEVSKLVGDYGARVVASVDMRLGQIVAGSKAIVLPLEELVKRFESEGASEILLLSLDRVGTAQGPDYSTLKRVLGHTAVPVLIGGGVRNVEDIRRLQKSHISGVLIATAFHTGSITKENIDQFLQDR